MNIALFATLVVVATCSWGATNDAEKPWVVFAGKDGPGRGKHVVFVTGDEEYRSEEGMPQIARILAERHGFRSTVLFAVHPATGLIDPGVRDNIPGLEALGTADLMVIFTRFRDLPDEQMKHIDGYVKSGKPIIGLRTATHAFAFEKHQTYLRYSWRDSEWEGGFGRQILGETWIAHHGGHGTQSTRGIIVDEAGKHPILRGLENGDVWDPSDVYEVRLPMLDGIRPLLVGHVLSGMSRDDAPLPRQVGVEGKMIDKNDPAMPVAWVKDYQVEGGRKGRVFATTLGTSQSFLREGTRRLLINACYWAVGLEDRIRPDSSVALVGDYEPRPFGFGGHRKGVRPADLAK